MSRTAEVVRLTLPPGRRVLVISDIHGNLPFLRGVLSAARYTPGDVLILLGDLVEKGPDSLAALRYVMALAEKNTVYCVRGNCTTWSATSPGTRGRRRRAFTTTT